MYNSQNWNSFSHISFCQGLWIKTDIGMDTNFPIKRRGGGYRRRDTTICRLYRRNDLGKVWKRNFPSKARGCTQRSKISRGRYNRKRPIISILQRSDPLTISGSQRNLGQQEENLCSPSPISLPIRFLDFSVQWKDSPSTLISNFDSNYPSIKFWFYFKSTRFIAKSYYKH